MRCKRNENDRIYMDKCGYLSLLLYVKNICMEREYGTYDMKYLFLVCCLFVLFIFYFGLLDLVYIFVLLLFSKFFLSLSLHLLCCFVYLVFCFTLWHIPQSKLYHLFIVILYFFNHSLFPFRYKNATDSVRHSKVENLNLNQV